MKRRETGTRERTVGPQPHLSNRRTRARDGRHPNRALLLTLISGGVGVIGVLVAIFAWILPRRAELSRKQEQRLIDGTSEQVISALQPYLDGLPNAEMLDVRNPFDAGQKLMDEGKWDAAIEEFRKAIPHAKGSQIVALYSVIGLCYFVYGRLSDALASYQKSLDLARECRDRDGEAATLANIGVIYIAKGEFDAAIKSSLDALAIEDEIGPPEEQPIVARSLARLRSKMGGEEFLAACLKLGMSRRDADRLATRLEAVKLQDPWGSSGEPRDAELVRKLVSVTFEIDTMSMWPLVVTGVSIS